MNSPERNMIESLHRAPQDDVVARLLARHPISDEQRQSMLGKARQLVQALREEDQPELLEMFLAEYSLTSEEGVSLMRLAEALLRVPDAPTKDDLIADKIADGEWAQHLGSSKPLLINAATVGLMLTRGMLANAHADSPAGKLLEAPKTLSKPVIRGAIDQIMGRMGTYFVLGRDIAEGIAHGRSDHRKGVLHSYDMLGEAAVTMADAETYFARYEEALSAIARQANSPDPKDNPGISIKLSALHPRYEFAQSDRVMAELAPKVLRLAQQAKAANIGLTIDAEEADRLEISLQIVEYLIAHPDLAGWRGLGVVVQAYGKRASAVIDWLYMQAQRNDRHLMIRLVKGAYWDSEIKQAQVDGLDDYPVFTSKEATDISYISCAQSLLDKTDRLFPQFATHNAHTMAAVLTLAPSEEAFEFQRLHGMGAALHDRIRNEHQTRHRIYAPVGEHSDLLAYLVRRLLENGANSSFVNQIANPDLAIEDIATDPFETYRAGDSVIALPSEMFGAARPNSRGIDLAANASMASLEQARGSYRDYHWDFASTGSDTTEVRNPAKPDDVVGTIALTDADECSTMLAKARQWDDAGREERAEALRKAADIYEENTPELLALLCREAGKTLADGIAEIREAVDFLRYYSSAEQTAALGNPRGIFACISPWNFPLAIFTGQIAAALMAGNGVLAKPAEETPLIAARAVQLLHDAGVPQEVLQLAVGPGESVGAQITSSPKIDGVCFTGSTATAQAIHRSMAKHLKPGAPLIAETGGINAMVVDSTALPEQAVTDIVASAFQSAGQRCSALRVLYVQEDIAPHLLEMLKGAMEELAVGDPWALSSDIGPIISAEAKAGIDGYIAQQSKAGNVLFQCDAPHSGHFTPPCLIAVSGIEAVEREVFGPVLHIATFKAAELDKVIAKINQTGFGLTFGLHSRLDDRADEIRQKIHAGNIYINRNQIGAIVGSQPFGGEGLSGTGPKAGGPHYLLRFCQPNELERTQVSSTTATVNFQQAQELVADNRSKTADTPQIAHAMRTKHTMPGPTGELNELREFPRGTVLCLGPGNALAAQQATIANAAGCASIMIAEGSSGKNSLDGVLEPEALSELRGMAVVAYQSDDDLARQYRSALAQRDGPIVPLVTADDLASYCLLERHTCIDTSAAGGNAALLAMSR